jgi:hypothetical protein
MNLPEAFVADMASHMVKPPDVRQNYLDTEFRDRAIRIQREDAVSMG